MSTEQIVALIGKINVYANSLSAYEREILLTEIERDLANLADAVADSKQPLSRDVLEKLDVLVKKVRDQRLFQQNMDFTRKLNQAGIETPKIIQQRIQSAIELGEFSLARAELDPLLYDPAFSDHQISEYHGLMARLNKQQFVNWVKNHPYVTLEHSAERLLRRAIALYGEQYKQAKSRGDIGEQHYHGVNFIATVWLAEYHDIPFLDILERLETDCRSAADIAKDLMGVLHPYAETELRKSHTDETKSRDGWSFASCGEALLALELAGEPTGDFGSSDYWYRCYALFCDEPFMLVSTLRQLEEVWLRKPDSEIGGRAMSLLRQRALSLGGPIELHRSDIARIGRSVMASDATLFQRIEEDWNLEEDEEESDGLGSYEQLVKGIEPTDIERLDKILELGESIGRINCIVEKATKGTGFLISGKHLGKAYASESFFITNAHVITDHSPTQMQDGSLDPSNVEIEFGRLRKGSQTGSRKFTCGEVIWTSIPEDLDTSIIRLNSSADGDIPPQLQLGGYELAGDVNGPIDTAFVMGYPGGENFAFTDQNNGVRRSIDTNDLAYGWWNQQRQQWLFVHYTSSTHGGNSGSPVFDKSLNTLYAIHHRGPKKPHLAEDLDNAKTAQQIRMLNGLRDKRGHSRTWVANQGVLLKSIIKQAREDLAEGRKMPLTPEQMKAKRKKFMGIF